MKSVSQKTDELLQDYLEGKLTGDKLEKVKAGIDNSQDLRDRLEVLRFIHLSMSNSELVHPSENFTHQVMSNLHRAPATVLVTPKNGLMLLCGILVAIGIGSTLVSAEFYNSLNGMLSLDQLKLPSGIKAPTMPSIPFNGKWIVNSILALNLGLAFLILDKTILKPFFSRRSKIQF